MSDDLARALNRIAAGDAHEAVEILTRLIDAEPRNTEAYRQRAIARLILNDRPRALADYNSALKINPNHHLCRRERAIENYHQRQYEICLEDCDLILAVDTKLNEILVLRGRCHTALGDSAAALADFEAAGAADLHAALLVEITDAAAI